MWRVRYTPNEATRRTFAQMEALVYTADYAHFTTPHREMVPPYSAITRDGYKTKEEAEAAIPTFCGKCPNIEEYSVEEY